MGLFTPFAYIKNQIAREDPDAVAFLTAAGITDPTITSAINTLVISMKSNGLWTKMIAIYPFVGGTATTHKFNLKNPADTDAAFRLVFSGGITHSSNGLVGNGTNGFYDTFITASTHLSQNDVSANVYIRNNVSEEKVDIGYLRSTPLVGFQLNSRDTSNLIFTRINSGATQSVSNTDSRGFFGISRTSSSSAVISKNTTQTSAATTSAALPAFKILGLCFNLNGSAGFFSTRQQAYSSLGQGLSDSELDTYYDIVQEFQTTLGRQV
jgi:hypothetical protein